MCFSFGMVNFGPALLLGQNTFFFDENEQVKKMQNHIDTLFSSAVEQQQLHERHYRALEHDPRLWKHSAPIHRPRWASPVSGPAAQARTHLDPLQQRSLKHPDKQSDQWPGRPLGHHIRERHPPQGHQSHHHQDPLLLQYNHPRPSSSMRSQRLRMLRAERKRRVAMVWDSATTTGISLVRVDTRSY